MSVAQGGLEDVIAHGLHKTTLIAKYDSTSPIPASTNFSSIFIAPRRPPCVFRIQGTFDQSGILTLLRSKLPSGGSPVSEQFNSGSALAANAAFAFDSNVDDGDWINYRYSVRTTPLTVRIYEIIDDTDEWMVKQ